MSETAGSSTLHNWLDNSESASSRGTAGTMKVENSTGLNTLSKHYREAILPDYQKKIQDLERSASVQEYQLNTVAKQIDGRMDELGALTKQKKKKEGTTVEQRMALAQEESKVLLEVQNSIQALEAERTKLQSEIELNEKEMKYWHQMIEVINNELKVLEKKTAEKRDEENNSKLQHDEANESYQRQRDQVVLEEQLEDIEVKKRLATEELSRQKNWDQDRITELREQITTYDGYIHFIQDELKDFDVPDLVPEPISSVAPTEVNVPVGVIAPFTTILSEIQAPSDQPAETATPVVIRPLGKNQEISPENPGVTASEPASEVISDIDWTKFNEAINSPDINPIIQPPEPNSLDINDQLFPDQNTITQLPVDVDGILTTPQTESTVIQPENINAPVSPITVETPRVPLSESEQANVDFVNKKYRSMVQLGEGQEIKAHEEDLGSYLTKEKYYQLLTAYSLAREFIYSDFYKYPFDSRYHVRSRTELSDQPISKVTEQTGQLAVIENGQVVLFDATPENLNDERLKNLMQSTVQFLGEMVGEESAVNQPPDNPTPPGSGTPSQEKNRNNILRKAGETLRKLKLPEFRRRQKEETSIFSSVKSLIPNPEMFATTENNEESLLGTNLGKLLEAHLAAFAGLVESPESLPDGVLARLPVMDRSGDVSVIEVTKDTDPEIIVGSLTALRKIPEYQHIDPKNPIREQIDGLLANQDDSEQPPGRMPVSNDSLPEEFPVATQAVTREKALTIDALRHETEQFIRENNAAKILRKISRTAAEGKQIFEDLSFSDIDSLIEMYEKLDEFVLRKNEADGPVGKNRLSTLNAIIPVFAIGSNNTVELNLTGMIVNDKIKDSADALLFASNGPEPIIDLTASQQARLQKLAGSSVPTPPVNVTPPSAPPGETTFTPTQETLPNEPSANLETQIPFDNEAGSLENANTVAPPEAIAISSRLDDATKDGDKYAPETSGVRLLQERAMLWARKYGLVDYILQKSYDSLTADQVASSIVREFTPEQVRDILNYRLDVTITTLPTLEVKNFVYLVRGVKGVPSMDDKAAYNEWKQKMATLMGEAAVQTETPAPVPVTSEIPGLEPAPQDKNESFLTPPVPPVSVQSSEVGSGIDDAALPQQQINPVIEAVKPVETIPPLINRLAGGGLRPAASEQSSTSIPTETELPSWMQDLEEITGNTSTTETPATPPAQDTSLGQ